MHHYEIQDGDGTVTLIDADSATGFQVSIAKGLNTIQIVVVTAEDASTQTYTITVTRPRTLISNVGQSQATYENAGNADGSQRKHAQKFTTGSNPAGYTIDQVKIALGTIGDDAVPVLTINLANGSNPGNMRYTLTNPDPISTGTRIFTAPAGATLDSGTDYFVSNGKQ